MDSSTLKKNPGGHKEVEEREKTATKWLHLVSYWTIEVRMLNVTDCFSSTLVNAYIH